MIDHIDPSDQETREDFWIFHLDTLHLHQKHPLKYSINLLIVLRSVSDLNLVRSQLVGLFTKFKLKYIRSAHK